VFLFDECHQLTNDAQNALLKALEEPPGHVYFLLATTDPQKLLKTVKGRCVVCNVSTLGEKEIGLLLNKVQRREGKKIVKEVVDKIVEEAQGVPRDALLMLGNVINMDKEEALDVLSMGLKEDVRAEAIELCRALIKGANWKNVKGVVDHLKESDAERIRRLIMSYCKSTAMKNSNPDRAFLIYDIFKRPFYDNGMVDLVFACYEATVVK
jgi:DNA polymerase III gamma/tau subunit